MSSYADFYRINVNASATIGGKKVAISGLSLNYHLDQIPDAFITVPLGSSASGNNTVTNPATFVASVVPYTPVTITLQAVASPSGRDGPTIGLPSTATVVFQGFIIRPGFVRTNNATAVVFTAVGQTAGLCRSTRFGAGLIDPNPNNSARIVTAKFGSGAKVVDNIYSIMGGQQNLYADIWANLLQKLMVGVTKVNESFGADNSMATAALNRINVGSYLPNKTLHLAGELSGNSLKILDIGLAKSATDMFFNNWLNANDPFNNGNADLWDAMEWFGRMFLFHFVPAATEDSVAPVTPGLSDAVYRVIQPADYFHEDLSVEFEKKFNNLYNRVALITSAFVDSAYTRASTSAPYIGYALVPLNGSQSGQILVNEAPPFLVPGDMPTGNVLNIAAGNPDAVNPTVSAPTFDKAAVESEFFSSGLGNNYASALLQEIMFEHRRMALVGRLRLDIAPGSSVQVNIPGEAGSSQVDTLYGMVIGVQVRVECGANGSFAHTGFMISHVRSQTEQDSYTVKQHPLYGQVWSGAPLVKM